METKELKIQIPEGQEIDWQESAKQEKIVFKKKDNKPRSWEEYCENHKGGYAFISSCTCNVIEINYPPGELLKLNPEISKHLLPSKELAEAFLAMMQIMSLRHNWIHKWSIDNGMIDDWKPDWNTSQYKYCITILDNEYTVDEFIHYHQTLSFPTRELAENFMNTFKDLLEIAKPLV